MTKRALLAALQQHEYNWPRFRDWYHRHQGQDLKIKPQAWTAKLRFINTVSTALFFAPNLVGLRLATNLLLPAELLVRHGWSLLARVKLVRLRRRGLVVVGVAGSYAKTSTKHIMAHLLGDQLPVYVTPKSVNTPLGIARVIWRHLKPDHRLLIVELGEYYPGDITQLADFIQPDYGVVTPVGRQHLERMGSLEAIAATIGELPEYFIRVNKPERLLVHRANYTWFGQDRDNHHTWYGPAEDAADSSDDDAVDALADSWLVDRVEVSSRGTEYVVHPPGRHQPAADNQDDSWQVFTPLYGAHQAVNTLPSFWLVDQLKLDVTAVTKRCGTLPYLDRRHQPTFAENDVLILDNSYNTNPDSWLASRRLLEQLPAERRIVITAGFVELGGQAEKLNRQLGRDLGHVADYVGLIETPWKAAIQDGFLEAGGYKTHLKIGVDQTQVLDQLRATIVPKSLVLFEGGWQEQYG